MVRVYRQPDGGDRPVVAGVTPAETDAAELVAQIRQLADADPAGVQQVVAEVLAALDRVTGGALRDQLPDGLSLPAGYLGAVTGEVTGGADPPGGPVQAPGGSIGVPAPSGSARAPSDPEHDGAGPHPGESG